MRPDRVAHTPGISLLLAAALVLPAPTAASRQTIDEKNSSWNCLLFFRLGDGPAALTGRYAQGRNFDGSQSSGVYTLWGTIRAEWGITGPPEQMRKRLVYFSADAPLLRDPKGVYGYLFGDDQLVSTITLLDPRDYRRGYSSSPLASFGGSAVEEALDRHDRWSLVLRSGDGTELVRRSLPLPDQRARAEALKVHRAAIETAWRVRDVKRLETVDASTLPGDRAHCLLSTPETREFVQNSAIEVDPLDTRRIVATPPRTP